MSKTKFEILVDAWIKSYNDFVVYKNECLKFITKTIVDGFAEYLGKPKCINLFNLKEGFDMQKSLGRSKSISLEDDAFWHFGVVLSLEVKNAKRFVQFHLALKKEDDKFIVKIEDWNLPDRESQFLIHADKSAELNKFYDTIFNKIKDDMEKGLKNFLNQKQKPKTIGFQAFEDESADE